MGVPGLWRILDMASKPINLDEIQGIKMAIDINPYLNRILHGTNANNWLFFVMRGLFSIIHYNIRVVVVFEGKRPLQKLFSYYLDDEVAFNRIRSAILRSSGEKKNSPKRKEEKYEPLATKTPEELQMTNKPVQNFPEDPEAFSLRQINKMKQYKKRQDAVTLVRPPASNPFLFYQEDKLKKATQEEVEKNIDRPIHYSAPKSVSGEYKSEFLDSISEIVGENSTSSDWQSVPDSEPRDLRVASISYLPHENPYLAPMENYITPEHIKTCIKMLDALGIPWITAPEEACAECARLEMEGIVESVASDDNNAILFGARRLIRNVFYRPHMITLSSLEQHGLTRKRLINLAMMIDGDYNRDIKKRLFTVGPVRGLDILSAFPDEDEGLYQFKDWWIKVFTKNFKETDPYLQTLAKHKWLKKLVMPVDFPPKLLMDAYKKPVVGDTRPKPCLPSFSNADFVNFMSASCTVKVEKIEEYVTAFKKRIDSFKNQEYLSIWESNPVNIIERLSSPLLRIKNYDKMKNLLESENDSFEDVPDE